MITKELLGLTNLTEAQTLYIYELYRIIIINKNKHLVFAAF